MILKPVLSVVATALTFAGFYPYIRSILNGETKPHVFSWVIWGVTTTLIFFGQWAGHGGVGIWSTGVSGVITIGIAILAVRRQGDIHISRLDWVFLAMALAAIPIWVWNSDPMWAVVILTLVDVLGFLPTIRKSYHAPHQENVTMYWVLLFRNLIAIGALETYSITTVIFPAAMSAAIGVLILIIKSLAHQTPQNKVEKSSS